MNTLYLHARIGTPSYALESNDPGLAERLWADPALRPLFAARFNERTLIVEGDKRDAVKSVLASLGMRVLDRAG